MRQKGFTLLEVLIVVAILGIVAAIAIPALLRARVSANEAAAIGDTRTVISAEVAYHSASSGYYGTITCLARPSSCLTGYTGPTFLDPNIGAGTTIQKQGYVRTWFETPDTSTTFTGALEAFCYQSLPAVPGRTGVRGFGGDQTGMVVESSGGSPCCTATGANRAVCVAVK